MKSLHVLPIKARSMEELTQRVRRDHDRADILEIWLDSLNDLRLAEIFFLKEEVETPFLWVNRAPFEGGDFRGKPEQQVELLVEAVERGAEWVDAAVQVGQTLIKKITKVQKKLRPKPKLILSYHNFDLTPSLKELQSIVQEARQQGAQVVKIATFAQTMDDNVTLFDLMKWARRKRIPVCANAMGPKGELSRIICPLLGSALYYAPLSEEERTAPGQLTKGELKAIWRHFRILSAT